MHDGYDEYDGDDRDGYDGYVCVGYDSLRAFDQQGIIFARAFGSLGPTEGGYRKVGIVLRG